MFRRRWSGLPEDRQFPSDMAKLGYFINDQDEIRSIANPDYYFKFYLTKNDRVNSCQRAAFNQAIENVIHARLVNDYGLVRTLLPLGTTDATQPHVPILHSSHLGTASRVTVLFGEPSQDLGTLALRICNGPGGVTAGSAIPLVREVAAQPSSATDPSPPAVLLANVGQLWWWPEGARVLSPHRVLGSPLPSAVHYGRAYDPKTNTVPGNEDGAAHVRYVFDEVLARLARADARVDVLTVSAGGHLVEEYLDDDDVMARWGPRINSLTLIGGCYRMADLTCTAFKELMTVRARAYVCDEKPVGTLISGAHGNPHTPTFTAFGCPVFSSGESCFDELILPHCLPTIAAWVREAATTPGYRNPLEVVFAAPSDLGVDEGLGGGADAGNGDGGGNDDNDGWDDKAWEEMPEEMKPGVSFYDQAKMQKELDLALRWKEFERTGVMPDLGPKEEDEDE